MEEGSGLKPQLHDMVHVEIFTVGPRMWAGMGWDGMGWDGCDTHSQQECALLQLHSDETHRGLKRKERPSTLPDCNP